MCIRDSSLPIYNFCQACKKTFPVICIRKNELKPAIRKFWFETMYNHWGDDNGIIFMKCILLVIKYEMKFSLCHSKYFSCLLYTSDAADERSSVDLGGRRIIK